MTILNHNFRMNNISGFNNQILLPANSDAQADNDIISNIALKIVVIFFIILPQLLVCLFFYHIVVIQKFCITSTEASIFTDNYSIVIPVFKKRLATIFISPPTSMIFPSRSLLCYLPTNLNL